MRSPFERIARSLGLATGHTIAWLFVVVVCVAISVLYHAKEVPGRILARDVLVAFVNAEVKGSIAIERIDEISRRRIIATNATVYDPQGRVVIRARKLVVYPDVGRALHAELIAHGADVFDAEVFLYPGAEEPDTPSLIEAFSPRTTGDGKSNGPTVDIRHIRVRGARAQGELLGLQNIDATDISAELEIMFRRRFELKAFVARARLDHPFDEPLQINNAMAHVVGDADVGSHLHAEIAGVRSDARATIALINRNGAVPGSAERGTRIDARFANVDADDLRAAHVPGMDRIALERMTGQVTAWFQAGRIRARAALASSAGPAEITAELDRERGSATVRTTGLRLAATITRAPDMYLAGSARVTFDREDLTHPNFEVDVAPTVYGEYPVPHIRARGRVLEDAVSIEDFSTPGERSRLAGHFTFGFDGSLSGDLRANIPDVGADPYVQRALPGASGSLTANVHAQRTADGTTRITGTGDVRTLHYGSINATSGRASGIVTLGERGVSARANVVANNVVISGTRLGNVTATVRGGPARYAITASTRAYGRKFDASTTLLVNPREFTLENTALAVTSSTVVWDGRFPEIKVTRSTSEVAIAPATLASGRSRIDLHGRYGGTRNPRGTEIDATLQRLDLRTLDALTLGAYADSLRTLRGSLDAHLKLNGRIGGPRPASSRNEFADLRVSLEGALTSVSYRALRDVDASYSLTFEEGVIVGNSEVQIAQGGFIALDLTTTIPDGNAPLSDRLKTMVFRLRASAEEFDLAAVQGPDPIVQGKVTGTVALSDTLQTPALDVSVEIDDFVIADVPPVSVVTSVYYARETGVVALRIADEYGTVGDAELNASQIDYRELISSPLQAIRRSSWTVRGNIAQRLVNEIPIPARYRLPLLPVLAGGSFNVSQADGRVNGDAELRASVPPGVLSDECAQDAAPEGLIAIHARGNVLTVAAHGSLQPDVPVLTTAASLDLPIEKWLRGEGAPIQPALRLTARLARVELGQVPIVCRYAQGTAEGSVALTDPGTAEARIRGIFNSPNLKLGNAPAVATTAIVSVTPRAFVLELSTARAETGEHSAVQMTVQSAWSPGDLLPRVPENAQFILQSEFAHAHLAPLGIFVPSVEGLDAKVTGRVQAQGTFRDVNWNGELNLEEGTVELLGPGQHLDRIAGRIVFDENHADLSDIVARDGDGSISVGGRLNFEGLYPKSFNLNVSMNQFPARREGTPLALLSGRAVGTGEMFESSTNVEVNVRELRVRVPDDTGGSLQPLEEHPDITVVGEDADASADTIHTYYIHIVTPETVARVERQDFRIAIGTDVTLIYAAPSLRLRGRVVLPSGTFNIFGRTFTLERGALGFDGGEQLDPTVDIVAVHSIRGTNEVITALISGRLETGITVDYRSSVAGLSRAEIISLLVSGRTSSSSSSSTANSRASEDEAGNFLTGLFGGVLATVVGAQTGGVGLVPIIRYERDAALDATKAGAGFDATAFIRDSIPQVADVIQGASVEFVSVTGNRTGSTSGGVRVELQFPNRIVGRGVFIGDHWGLDALWEP